MIDKAVDEGVADKKEIGTAVRVRPFCVSLSLSLSLSLFLSECICVCVCMSENAHIYTHACARACIDLEGEKADFFLGRAQPFVQLTGMVLLFAPTHIAIRLCAATASSQLKSSDDGYDDQLCQRWVLHLPIDMLTSLHSAYLYLSYVH